MTLEGFIGGLANSTSKFGVTEEDVSDIFDLVNETNLDVGEFVRLARSAHEYAVNVTLLYLCHVKGGPEQSGGLCDRVLAEGNLVLRSALPQLQAPFHFLGPFKALGRLQGRYIKFAEQTARSLR
eukprot:CAMPEP_0168430484 /NCGR_PEP_ID=MMETSP0228-20121227/37903_1 /TAXON_ID=133427 /ORGANISM="Protoceratium reticulatum, Strain CCCM 535 (=CCMP 1889)" /LENGTH=124 /DNA_ID=CAMNT_0008444589 /DNA_START=104 /DNA_END=474 /DNA_ORIENTATION=-